MGGRSAQALGRSRVKKKARARKLETLAQGPRAVLEADESAGPFGLDAYLDREAVRGLPAVRENAEIAAATGRLADLIQARYGDPWLQDALREVQRGGDASPLLRVIDLNVSGEAEFALESARSLARHFDSRSEVALSLRARVEEVYSLHRAMLPADCVKAAKALQPLVEDRGYRWLMIQNQLEYAVCESQLELRKNAVEKFRSSEKLAVEYGLRGLALRATGMLINSYTTAGDPLFAWEPGLGGLREYWESPYPGNRAHQFYLDLSAAAKHLDLPFTALQFGRAAMEQLAAVHNRPLEVAGYARVAALALTAGFPDEAAKLYERAAEISSSLAPSETTEGYKLEAELAHARAELDIGLLQAAKQRLEALPEKMPVSILAFDRLALLGELYLRMERYEDAEREYSAALHLAENRMHSRGSGVDRLRDLDEYGRATRGTVEAMLRSGRDSSEALKLWVRYRSGLKDPGALPTPPAGEVFVVYAALGERIAAWAIDRHGPSFRWLTAKRSQIAESADNLLGLISSQRSDIAEIQDRAYALYQVLLAPFEDKLGSSQTLFIAPDGELSSVPFSVLAPGKGRYLGQERTVVLRGHFSARASEPAVTRNLSVLVIANGSARESGMLSLPPLPEAEQEGVAVARKFSKYPLVGDEAKVSAAMQGLSSADVFHFAGHGFSNAGNGALVLADGLLTSHQIASAHLTRCRLVVLSACLTAAGESRGPLNPESLVRAFLEAGAREVVASTWNVDTRATRRLMDLFYDALLSGLPAPLALQHAAALLKADTEFNHPYYWGAFQIYR